MTKTYIIIFIIGLVTSGISLIYYDALPLKHIQVVAPFYYVKEQEVQQVILDTKLQDESFFSINMQEIKQKLMSNPWIYNVNIKRVWPDKLRISFNEDSPVAYLNNNGIITLRECKIVELSSSLNDTLKTEELNKDDFILPKLVGNKKKSKKLCDTLEKLQKSVKPIDVRIKKLVMSQRDSVYIELEDGLIVLLGNKDIIKRAQKFVSYYNKLNNGKDAKKKFAYIDMRYRNGLAVGMEMKQNLIEIMETA